MTAMRAAQILFIDAYDSFTNNIVSLLETELSVKVVLIKIDEPLSDFSSFVTQFAAVVAGPGPGHPANSSDVGLVRQLWTLKDEELRPVLGICLGFQSLVHAFGGAVEPMRHPRHGVETRVMSKGSSIFYGLDSFLSVQYHSLQAILGHNPQEAFSTRSEHIWRATESCPDLEPLAWDLYRGASFNSSEERCEPVLMAVKHVSKPFYGIQFHPESVCSQPEAKTVIKNWWQEVQLWLAKGHGASSINEGMQYPECHRLTDMLWEPWISASSSVLWSSPCSSPTSSYSSSSSTDLSFISAAKHINVTGNPHLSIYSRKIPLGDFNVPCICSTLQVPTGDCIILDSENRQMPEVGRYSIIGIISEHTTYHMYSAGSREIHVKTASSTDVKDLSCHSNNIFQYLKSIVDECIVIGDSPDIPFWGGLMGYITYEACLETIDVPSQTPGIERPDICFAFVERSLVVDHEKQTVYVQSIKQDDQEWVDSTVNTLAKIQPLRDREPHVTSYAKVRTTPNIARF